MRRTSRLARIALPLIMAVGITVAGIGPAFAQIDQVCDTGNSGLCLNDWNNGGNNNAIKMYYSDYSNDDFSAYALNGMCNHGEVSATMSCPFTPGSGLNTRFNNDGIFAIEYEPKALCVGTTQGSEPAILTPCPSVYGTNGGWGTIWVGGAACNSGGGYYESVHWSDATAPEASALQSGGTPGVQAYVTGIGNGAASCWRYFPGS